jgi:hypothetical protein
MRPEPDTQPQATPDQTSHRQHLHPLPIPSVAGRSRPAPAIPRAVVTTADPRSSYSLGSME